MAEYRVPIVDPVTRRIPAGKAPSHDDLDGLDGHTPSAVGQSSGLTPITDGADGWTLSPAGAGSALTIDPQLHTYNLTPDSLRNWRSAMGRVRANTGDATIMVLGSSSVAGGDTSYTAHAATLLAERGHSVRRGYNIPGAGASENGTRPSTITIAGSGWADSSEFGHMYWPSLVGTVGAAGTIDYAPAGPIDTFVVIALGTSGSIQAAVDGGAYNTYSWNTTPANATARVVIPAGPAGTHVLHVKPPASGSNPTILSLDAYNTGARSLRWIASGKSASTLPSTPSVRLPLVAEEVDLLVIAWGKNDFTLATPLATFQANLETWVETVRALSRPCDILLWGWQTGQVTTNSIPLDEQDYLDAVAQIAIDTGCPVLRVDERWDSYSVSNPLGLYADSIHASTAGKWDIGAALAGILT